MSDKMREFLPGITEEDRQLLHYNPNTDDLVEWAQDYAIKAMQAAQSAAVPVVPYYSVTQLQRLKSLMSELGLSTDESLEGFCLDADRQLSRAITAMEKTLATLKSVPVVGEVVAWECKDYGDGWIIFQDKEIAENYQRQSGCLMNKLVIQPTTSITAAKLDALRKDAERFESLCAALVANDMDYGKILLSCIEHQPKSIDEIRDAIDAAIAGEGLESK